MPAAVCDKATEQNKMTVAQLLYGDLRSCAAAHDSCVGLHFLVAAASARVLATVFLPDSLPHGSGLGTCLSYRLFAGFTSSWQRPQHVS